ncbi:uncharacterized protein B0P05DRAFT_543334 [Gilbertella persicaria]|uniref:uncharacterized protein n=1 Tax=Gilbertella persicaria TaxID=101096 RepID=UPI002220DCAC|nr:uncharacterized protein B0P05DRAFT_543334 [Gilbertella persicaria]KAI8077920.1 hypothetical protein B0P05DRAFT_543334 [Gilbertella persicaria]
MFQKLFVLATIALAAVNAHPGSHKIMNVAAETIPAATFTFSEKFPEPGSIPTPKPEWLELIKNVNITKAPVYKVAPGQSPQPEVAGQDPYCDWTFTGCFGKDDLYQCPKDQWALTFDDGPSEFSPKLYDYLDKENIKVTFFMVGGQVTKFPDYVLRAYKAGHEIAMHTYSHNYMTSLTNEQIVAELKWNELAIKEVTGVSPRFFRPPYGDIDNRVRDVAAALGFVPIIWNYDTNDWAAQSNPATYKQEWIDGNVTQWANNAKTAKVGGISLEHDLYSSTVDAAIRVIPILKKAYTLTPAGACNNVQVYKEGTVPASNSTTNATVSAVSSSMVASSSIPVSSVVVAAATTTVAPAAASTSAGIAANIAGSTSDASSLAGTSAFALGIAAIAAIALH